MPEIFRRKKFSYYLGEQRALDDIIIGYTNVPTPTPTPSITPSNTPTGTPNPTATPTPSVTATQTPTNTQTPTQTQTNTPTNTSTPTNTPTNTTTPTNTPSPTATPNPLCPQQLILSASSPNYLYGLYNRATIYTGGTFETAWYNFDDNVMNYGTNPDGNDYVAFSINSGSDYTSLYWSSDIMGNDGNWTIAYSTGNTLFNGGTIINSIVLDPDSLTDGGSLFFPPNGNLQYNGGYISYPSSCPTPTPTATVTTTPTSSPAPPFDADAAAYLSAVLSAGGTLNSTISAATNTLFTSLKSNNLYSKLDVFYPMIGGTSGSTAIMGNRVSGTTYDIVWNNPSNITFNYSGVTGDGSSTYGDTNFNGYNLISSSAGAAAHLGLYVGTNNPGAYSEIGTRTNGNWIIATRFSNDFYYGWCYTPGGTELVFSTTDARGMYVQTRTSTTNSKAFRNGTQMAVVTVTESNTIPNSTVRILSDGSLYSARRLQFVSIGEGLNDTESTTLSTIINTFQTSLGRNTY